MTSSGFTTLNTMSLKTNLAIFSLLQGRCEEIKIYSKFSFCKWLIIPAAKQSFSGACCFQHVYDSVILSFCHSVNI